MSAADQTVPPDLSVRSILFAQAFQALPALVTLVALAVVYYTLDGVVFYVLLGGMVLALIAADTAVERSATGIAQKGVRQRMVATFDLTADKAYDVARFSPLAAGFCGLMLAGPGVAALALIVTFFAAHLAFAAWLRGRHDDFAPAPRS